MRRPALVLAAWAVLAAPWVACGSETADGPRSAADAAPAETPVSGTWSPYGPGWAAVHADARKSDYSPTATAADLALAWSTRIEGSVQVGPLPWVINLGPTVGPEGNLYVTSTEPGCHLRALDVATGELRWCAAGVDLAAVVSSPTVDREGVLFLADGAGLHAFDPDGRERWLLPVRGVPLSVQFTPDGWLVFVTNIGVVYLVERETGRRAAEPVELAPRVAVEPVRWPVGMCAGSAGVSEREHGRCRPRAWHALLHVLGAGRSSRRCAGAALRGR